MRIATCIPCQHGDHDKHYEVVQAVVPGVMGGAKCLCKGECRDRRPESYSELIERLAGGSGGE